MLVLLGLITPTVVETVADTLILTVLKPPVSLPMIVNNAFFGDRRTPSENSSFATRNRLQAGASGMGCVVAFEILN